MDILALVGYAGLQGLEDNSKRAYGVPAGGCFDRFTSQLLRHFLKLGDTALMIEVAMASMTIQFSESGVFAWAGEGCSFTCKKVQVLPWTSVKFVPGDTLHVSPVRGGVRGWICFGSEIDLEHSDISKRDEGDERVLSRGDRLILRDTDHHQLNWRFAGPSLESFEEIRFISSFHSSQMESQWATALTNRKFTISIHSNRVGIRMNESIGTHTHEGLSEPSAIGMIQLPPDGVPIIHGPDGPTTGGYPRIGTVIEADWWKLGQLKPLQKIQFRKVSVKEAEQSRLRLSNELKGWKHAMDEAYTYFLGMKGSSSIGSSNEVS